MTLLIQVFFFSGAVVAVALAVPASPNLKQQNICNNSTSPEEYVIAAQNQIFSKVELGRINADAIDARYADRLAVIELQQQEVLKESEQLNETFTQMQYLSYSRKYCIKAYDWQWEYFDKAQQQFNDCNIAASILTKNLTYTGRSYLSKANSTMYQLTRNIKECTIFSKNQTNLEDCYVHHVTDGSQRAQLQLDAAQKTIRQSLLDMDDYTLTAVKCTYRIQLRVQDKLKTFKRLVSDCVGGFESFLQKSALN